MEEWCRVADMKPSLDEINANRSRVGMPPLSTHHGPPHTREYCLICKHQESERPLNSRERGDKENRDADERMLQLRDVASSDPEAQAYVRARLVDRDEGKLRVVADHRGKAWEVWYYVALDVMDYFGLHGPFLDAEQTPDLYSAYNQAESVIQARGGNTYWHTFKRARRRSTRREIISRLHAAMANEEEAALRGNGGQRESTPDS